MTIQDAKQIKLADYLQSLGYMPVKQQGKNLWYKSPLWEETDASFKVNTELEKWYDFGIGKGGNIIALAAELYHSENVTYLLECIAKQTPHLYTSSHTLLSLGRQSVPEPMYRHLQITELSSPALLSYLQERRIMPNSPKKNVRNCISRMVTSDTLPSASRTWQEDMRCAIVISRDALPRKTSPISDRVENHVECVICSRASWTTFRSLPSE